MMHKIKKAATTTRGTENAEFSDYKNRLENLSNYLSDSSAALNLSEKAWKEVCQSQKIFAEKFANKYPDKDQVRKFGKQSAECSQLLVKEFVLKTEGSTAAHWQVDAVVQDYLSEITAISQEYKDIADHNKEVSMYTKKVDDLQNAKKPDDSKIARNMEKLEEAKKKYEDLLDRVVEKMKEVYNKRAVALKATYVAYWSSQLRAFNLLDASLDPTREFVETSMENISKIKINSMTPEDVASFISANASVPDSKASSPARSTFALDALDAKTVPTSPVEGGGKTEIPAEEPTPTAV